MAKLFKPCVYTLSDGGRRTSDGQRVTAQTPGAVGHESTEWHGKYKNGEGRWVKVRLCANKEASRQLLVKLSEEGRQTRDGLINPALAAHRRRPLAAHLEDFTKSLRAKGNTEAHVNVVVTRAGKVIDGCNFLFISDLSASRVQEFVADLRRARRQRAELTKDQYTLTEASVLLQVKPAALSAMVARNGLEAIGAGKARRYPRATVQALQDRWSRGRAIQTANFYLAAIKQFSRWLLKDRRMVDNPLAHLSGGNVELDRRHDRRALSLEQLRAILQAAASSGVVFRGLTGDDRAMLYATAMGTGFRVAELGSLEPESFNLDGLTVRVEAGYTKNRKEVVQPIRQDLAEALRGTWQPRRPESRSGRAPGPRRPPRCFGRIWRPLGWLTRPKMASPISTPSDTRGSRFCQRAGWRPRLLRSWPGTAIFALPWTDTRTCGSIAYRPRWKACRRSWERNPRKP
jgi:integrase